MFFFKVWREDGFISVWWDMVRVRMCVKLLKNSNFQGLFVLQAIEGF